MKHAIEKVTKFHVATGQPVLPRPAVPPHDRVRLRAKLIFEESMETIGALFGFSREDVMRRLVLPMNHMMDQIDPQAQIVDIADGLADLIYVCIGCALEMGIPLEAVFDEVQRSNMSKTIDSKLREDGKIQKGPKFSPPDIGAILDLYA